MANILLIETTTQICSVGLATENGLSVVYEETGSNIHAARVPEFVKMILENHKIEAVAVSSGPGSYTGLRIGVSVAKGLAYGSKLPLIAVPTLDALADYTAHLCKPDKDTVIISTMDARRMEVYASVYDHTGEKLENEKPVILTDESFFEYAGKNLIIVGNGSEKTFDTISHEKKKAIRILPCVAAMSRIAQKKYEERQFEDVAYFEPFYLKKFLITKSKKKLF